MDPKVMESLGLSPGDVIEITGKGKKSHAVVWTGYPEDYGRGLIRIDGYTRNNLGVGIDDTVSIAPANAKEAQEVVLAPTEQLSVEGLEEAFPEILENRVMTKGDSLPFSIMGKKIDFVVDSTSPSGAVVVTLETTVQARDDAQAPRTQASRASPTRTSEGSQRRSRRSAR